MDRTHRKYSHLVFLKEPPDLRVLLVQQARLVALVQQVMTETTEQQVLLVQPDLRAALVQLVVRQGLELQQRQPDQ